MERHELEDLHYITHVANVVSISAMGVLSNRQARRLDHTSVADPEVQDRRKGKRVPGGLLLHDYANIYVTARNPMLFRRIREGMVDDLCVFRICPAVLDLDGVVVTDRNAAADYCRFRPAAQGIAEVDAELIARTYWRDGDALERDRCWNAKFTEVLVPQKVEPVYLAGIDVGTDAAEAAVKAIGLSLPVSKNRRLFFNP